MIYDLGRLQRDKNQLWRIKRVNKKGKRDASGKEIEELVEVTHEELLGDSDQTVLDQRDLFEDLDLDTSEFEAYKD